MEKIDQEPTYYPRPYALGIQCPIKSCRRPSPNFCYNPLATPWTMTHDKEQYHYIHEKRRITSTRYLVENPAYYRLKTDSLSERKYLIGRYYPIYNTIVEDGTEDMYPRDMYTFHGFVFTPEKKSRRKLIGPGTDNTNVVEDNPHGSEELDFNF